MILTMARASALALAAGFLVGLTPASPAVAAENCPGVLGKLTNLQAQYKATTAQLKIAITATLNGTVSMSVINQAMTGYTSATNTAGTQLPGQGTCQISAAVGQLLATDITLVTDGKTMASSALPPMSLEQMRILVLQLQTALVTLIGTTEQVSPGSKQHACLRLGEPTWETFPGVQATCGL